MQVLQYNHNVLQYYLKKYCKIYMRMAWELQVPRRYRKYCRSTMKVLQYYLKSTAKLQWEWREYCKYLEGTAITAVLP